MKIFLGIVLILSLCVDAKAVNYTDDANCPAAYLLEEGTGTTTADETGNGHTGTFEGVGYPDWASASPPAAYSDWYVVNEADTYGIAVPDNAALDFGSSTDFSVVFWTKKADEVFGGSVSKRAYNGAGWWFYYYNTGGYIRINDDSSGDVYSFVGGDFTAWSHMACTADRNGNLIAYVDGSVTDTQDMSAIGNISNGADLLIGSSPGYDRAAVSHDEVALFSRIISSVEIGDIKTNGLLGSAPPVARRIMFIN